MAILIAAAVASAWLREMSADELSGTVRVADGDTLVLGGERLRLRGIDAPELHQTCRVDASEHPCGRAARDALRTHIGKDAVDCRSWERDRYGRRLVSCTLRGGDLGAWLVGEGHAVAYGRYDREEAAARLARRGVWEGTFERPQDWRRQHGGMADDIHDVWHSLSNLVRRFFRAQPSEPIVPASQEDEHEAI